MYKTLNLRKLRLVTGALWKVASNAENVDRLEDLGIVQTLIKVTKLSFNSNNTIPIFSKIIKNLMAF